MEFTFDVSQTPVIGRRYLKGSGMVVLPGQISAGSSTVSSATSDSLQDREQVRVWLLQMFVNIQDYFSEWEFEILLMGYLFAAVIIGGIIFSFF